MDSGLRAQAPGYSSASASMMEATERFKMINNYGRRHPTDLVSHRMLGQPSTYDRQLKSIIGNVSCVSLCVTRPEYPLGRSIKRPVFVCARIYSPCSPSRVHAPHRPPRSRARTHAYDMCLQPCMCAEAHAHATLQNYSTFQEAHSATYQPATVKADPQTVVAHRNPEMQPASAFTDYNERVPASDFVQYKERVISIHEKSTLGEPKVSTRAECHERTR